MASERKPCFSFWQATVTSTLYVSVALLVNFTISLWPPREVLGINMPPGLLLVGIVFVMRDYAHRDIGHWVIALTFIAAILTYYSIDPLVALASGTAFIVSESIDWLIFYRTDRLLKDRILISSAIAVPFDGVIFLGMMGWMNWQHFWSQEIFWVHYGLKMIASLTMWLWLTNRSISTSAISGASS
jgi:uncharacterized PurR-regulated membrane protein YhhQ (DUF165 family)